MNEEYLDHINQKTIVFNSLGKCIPRLDLYELAVPWSSPDGFYATLLLLLVVFLSDHSQIPLTMKIWGLSLLWFGRLIWDDIQLSLRGRKLVIIPPASAAMPSGTSNFTSSRINAETVQMDALERISLLECDVHLTTVKILEEDELLSLTMGTNNSNNTSTARRKSMTEFPSRLLFRIEISTNVKRWYLWRRYEDVLEVYYQLVLLHGKEHIPRLKSFATVAKAFHKEATAGRIVTMTSMTTLNQPFAYSLLHQDAMFIQFATETLTQWFVQIQQLPQVRDDITVRSFLQLPPLSSLLLRKTQSMRYSSQAAANNNNTAGSLSPFTSTKKAPTTYPLTMDAVAEVPDSILLLSSQSSAVITTTTSTSTSTNATTATSTVQVSEQVSAFSTPVKPSSANDAADSSVTVSARSATQSHLEISSTFTQTQTHTQSHNEPPENPDARIHTYYLEDGVSCVSWRGTTIDTFEFLDFPEPVRQMVADRRYSHGFKLRGVSYMQDKKKIEADPAIGRFLWYDVFPVDTELFGDRHDHAAAIFPMAQHRIRIIQSLKDKPFVFLVNFQIPGDPPLTGLAYFAIPGDFHPDCAHSVDLQKAKRLFDKFIDLPLEDPSHKITLPDLAKQKNQLQRQQSHHSNRNSNNNNNNINNDNSSSHHVQRQGSSRAVHVEESVHISSDAQHTTTFTSSHAVEVIGEAKILSSPVSTQQSITNNNSANELSTMIAQETINVPGLGKADGSQWKAVQPTKAWGADIAWAAVGEPGVLDRKAFQNMRFKLVPQMGEAPWVVQMAVSSTPCLLGTKIVQRYFRGEGYLEVDLHIGSSGIANNVVGLCRKYTSAFVCNLGVVIQGESTEELPERVLICMSMVKMQIREQVAVTAAHVEHLHAFMREQMSLPMPLVSPSAKVLQEVA